MIDDNFINHLLDHPIEARISLLSSLENFIRVFHYYINKKQFIVKDFHRKIIHKLEDMVFLRNEKQNLYIGICPRSGKSQICLYFECWGFAHNPKSNYLSLSYSDSLVNRFSKQVRDLINSELYQKIFGLYVPQSSSATNLWKNNMGGEYRATTVSGTVTGFGAGSMQNGWGGCIIIDDFLKAQDYRSATEKGNVIDYYENAIKSRRNNPKTPIVVIAQRLAKDDLIGYIQENEADDWDFFILPTLNENDESMWEDKFPAQKMIKMRETNPFLFYSQYQQEPIVLGGTVIKEEWFRFYPTYQNTNFTRLYITADTALKVKQANDYTAIGLWGMTDKNDLYLIDLLHGKWEAPDLERQFIAFWNKWRNGINYCKPNGAYIEDKASGTGLIQSIKHKGVPVIPYEPEKDKLTRVMDVSPYIESGLLYLPMSKDFEISKKVINESVAFTADDSHAHDDIVDCMSMALNIAYRKQPLKVAMGWDEASEMINNDL